MQDETERVSGPLLLDAFAEQAEREFRGHTFNGYSLIETVGPMNAVAAASRDTYEGYSAWENVVHVVFFKYFILRALCRSGSVDPYPWEEGSFPPIPDTSEEAWRMTLAYANRVHDAYTSAVRSLDVLRLDRRIEEWDCSLFEALIWIPTHDAYHTAQIRNMGLPSLRNTRE